MKRILSIDIGIKNLAFCIVSNSGDSNNSEDVEENEIILPDKRKYNIEFLDCISTLEGEIESNSKKVCSGITKKLKPCGYNAKYKYKNSYYCKKHLPEDMGQTSWEENSFQELCINVYKTLDKLIEKNPIFLELTHIFIENQFKTFTIGKRAGNNPKLNFIADCVFSYFVRVYIDNNDCEINWISPKDKLKISNKENCSKNYIYYDGPIIKCKLKTKYARNKFYSVEYTKYFIKDNEKWLSHFNNFSKLDDMTDAFLLCLHCF